MRLSDGLEAARQPRGQDPLRLLAALLALPIHLLSVALLAAAGYVAATGDGWGRAFAAVPLLVAVGLRPRLPRRAAPGLMDAADYPETAALVSEVARAVGTRPPTSALVDVGFSAAVGPAGLRGRQLVVGASLWLSLGPQARVALLGHELGHLANGDVLSGRWVASGYFALLAGLDILSPEPAIDPTAAGYHRAAGLLLAPARFAIHGYLWLFHRVAQSSNRRQETFADLVAVRTAGSDGAVDLLETLLAASSVEVTLNRAAITGTDLYGALAARRSAYDAAARATARRYGAQRESRADDSHPPTTQRLALVESVPRAEAQVVVDLVRNARLEAELRPSMEHQLREDAYRFLGH